MNFDELKQLLTDIGSTRIAVIGDFCLDVYWTVDPSVSEVSFETGLATRPVSSQSAAPGAAGNVVSNLLALGCKSVHALGVVGDDPWGREMLSILGNAGTDISKMIVEPLNWSTMVYLKPIIRDIEDNRFDFGRFNTLPDTTAEILLSKIHDVMPQVDVVIISEQVTRGIHTAAFRDGLNEIIKETPDKVFILNSRHCSDTYPGVCLKLNDHEAARLAGIYRSPDALVLREEAIKSGKDIFERWQKPVFITRGNRGLIVYDKTGIHEIPGIQVMGKTDSLGAGDSCLAGIAVALAVGRKPSEAAELANIVASVTIQKLGQTGTASPDEVLEAGNAPCYIYRPEIAEDPRQARFHNGSEIEIVTDLRPGLKATHVIFDHDGTISTLRQGWEEVMEPMMVKAILGDMFDTADESLYQQVVSKCRDFIDKSTGIQTLTQMHGLIGMIRDFGCVPEDKILDEFGYKKIYNDALMERVQKRVDKLNRGELSVEDFTIKNAVHVLEILHKHGARLYLASGTDEPDVRAEAEAMGYAGLFNGGIFGAVGDVTREAKREVLDRILKDVGPSAETGLVAIGDGPVEIRETHRRGGFTVGIASNELQRFGSDPSKRSRLVRAGADIIIPDYSQCEALLTILGIDLKQA